MEKHFENISINCLKMFDDFIFKLTFVEKKLKFV